jgi:hypothetical protein
MATATGPEQTQTLEHKIQQLRELFADAPELGKKALENALRELKSQASDLPPAVESAGRVGARLGKVSELTIIVPLAPGGAKRLRAFLRLLRGNLSQGADKVGTLHTMRFAFFDNDTRLLFATAFDGDWDTYIDDFVAKIPDARHEEVLTAAKHIERFDAAEASSESLSHAFMREKEIMAAVPELALCDRPRFTGCAALSAN